MYYSRRTGVQVRCRSGILAVIQVFTCLYVVEFFLGTAIINIGALIHPMCSTGGVNNFDRIVFQRRLQHIETLSLGIDQRGLEVTRFFLSTDVESIILNMVFQEIQNIQGVSSSFFNVTCLVVSLHLFLRRQFAFLLQLFNSLIAGYIDCVMIGVEQ